LIEDADAVLIGPGMRIGAENDRFVSKLLPECMGLSVVLDAGALGLLTSSRNTLEPFGGNAVITPHAGEMATFLDIDRSEVTADPLGAARHVAKSAQCVVIMKGACTHIVSPAGEAWSSEEGNVGLATSGSGDVLAGIIAGLLARGAFPLVAAQWGVYLHAAAGERLARSVGPIGYLARQLAAEIPALLAEIGRSGK